MMGREGPRTVSKCKAFLRSRLLVRGSNLRSFPIIFSCQLPCRYAEIPGDA